MLVFPVVMYGCERWTIKKAKPKELMPLKHGFGNTLESPLGCKAIQPVHPKGTQSWIFIKGTDTEAETPILWPPDVKNWLIGKKPWCWERLNVGGERDDRGWDGWMASLTQWTWVLVNSGSWWWTGRPVIAAVHGVTKSRIQLSDWTELTHEKVFYFLKFSNLFASFSECPMDI